MIKSGSVRKRGNKWYYSFDIGKIDGKRKRVEKVCKNATTEAQAYRELAEAIKLYESGGILSSKNDDITVNDFLNLWYDSCIDLSPSTQKNYKNAMSHFNKMYGIYKVKTISKLTAQEFVNKLAAKGLKRKTIKLNVNIIHIAFNFAINHLNIISQNPIVKYKIPKDKTEIKLHKAYEENEVYNLLQYFKDQNLYEYYITVMIAYRTGMREGEIFGLSPDDVDLKNGIISVTKNLQTKREYTDSPYYITSPKTKSSIRQIPIDDVLKDELIKYNKYRLENKLKYGEQYAKYFLNKSSEVVECKTNEPVEFFVCRQWGKYISSSSLAHTLQRISVKYDCKYTMHSLRHTHCSMLIENGLNIKAVQVRLGHTNIQTTLSIYAETTKKSVEETKRVMNEMYKSTILSAK